MPSRAPSTCTVPLCPALVPYGKGSRCPDHSYVKTNPGYRARQNVYKTARWRAVRLNQLRRSPWCAMCGTLADTVDHIERFQDERDPLCWSAANHQSLCRSCHTSKSNREARE
jgi:5-methylcytosine-specific restriction protein A